jgi:hypothetical protein
MPACKVEWLEEAKEDIRALDRSTAMRVFDAVLHFTRTGAGNVTALHGDMAAAPVSITVKRCAGG